MQNLSRVARITRQHRAGFLFPFALWRLKYGLFGRNGVFRDAPSGPSKRTVRYLDREFELHPSGKGLSEEMALFGTHEPVATRFYLQHLHKGDHVLDLGSNLGYYLLLAAQAVGLSGRVLGFEPAPGVYAILERNVERSALKNIQIFPWAIGNRNGTTEFYESKIPNWGSMFKSDRCFQTGKITVPLARLDDILKQFPGLHPNVLRTDVEGGELAVLEGAGEVLAKYRPIMTRKMVSNCVARSPGTADCFGSRRGNGWHSLGYCEIHLGWWSTCLPCYPGSLRVAGLLFALLGQVHNWARTGPNRSS